MTAVLPARPAAEPRALPGIPVQDTFDDVLDNPLDSALAGAPARMFATSSATGVLVRLTGEVDAACLAHLPGVLAVLDAADRRLPVLLDTQDVTFMDSSGVALLERVRGVCRATGAPLALLDPAPAVMTVLRLVGLEDAVPVVRTRDDRA
ncbi:STAS domain-containing protein [Isoptericola sp. NPDC057191]|uniref:STAS domain-containing protein n=1 Tax=Isoptericola sp. NPDC057191 TaxID=3346041 RepID=UPI00363755C6